LQGNPASAKLALRWRPDTAEGYCTKDVWGRREDDSVASYTKDREAYLNRLRRIEGQIRGLQRMVEQDQYCIDVLTQVSAATKALQSFALALLEEHMVTCVVDAAADRADAGVKVKEAADAIARLVRS
jgi:CsoR family transcriptional regulator, copper-sensing transcriptional repressor